MAEIVIVLEQLAGCLIFGLCAVAALFLLIGAAVSFVSWQIDKRRR